MSNLTIDDDSLFGRFDRWLLLAVSALCVISVFAIYSAGVDSNGISRSNEWIKQIVWVITGFAIYFSFAFINYRRLRDVSLFVYLAMLFLLVLVLVAGSRVNGSLRWLGIGPFGVQPSELAKIAAILSVASYLDGQPTKALHPKQIITSFLVVMPFVFLVMLQPDAGSSILFLAVVFIMLFFAGAPMPFILFTVLTAGLMVFYILVAVWDQYLATKSFWLATILTNPTILLQMVLSSLFIFVVSFIAYLQSKKDSYSLIAFFASINTIALSVAYMARIILKPYQEMRLVTFLQPTFDAQGAGYQVLQSLTAIGSGGIGGKGYLKGSHSHLRYLPEQSTDFIFSIILEETGFIGGMVIIALFSIILFRLLYISRRSPDLFGSYLCYGVFAVFFFHVLVNVGMVIGVVPITGIPLLLLSYGGSSMWTAMALLGICNSVYIKRYKN